MAKLLLLGNEACARGAIDAGCAVAYGYPGTPSSEIMEYLLLHAADHPSLVARWCTNEKTALEGAMGVSFAGKRVLAVMKHVGLNVAADAFVNAVLQKINGGLVVAVADDPGMHSSQNEQDTRCLADFAKTICFEPGSPQETYSMMREAFYVSEQFNVPVVLRMVTRLSHSRTVIETADAVNAEPRGRATGKKGEWMCLPLYARRNYRNLLDRRQQFYNYSTTSPVNHLESNPSFRTYGVITTGIAGGYYREVAGRLPELPSHLHIGVYPVPEVLVKQLAKSVDRLLIIEEGYPFVEEKVRSIAGDPIPVNGKMDGSLPDQGELLPDHIRELLALPSNQSSGESTAALPVRFSQLCAGCPHKDSFDVLRDVVAAISDIVVTSDIGCYTLGALPPYNLLDMALCMGASIGMARGAVEAGCTHAIAMIGDSSLLHSGIPPLLDAIAADAPIVVMVLDNGTTAMTGGQDTVLSSDQLYGLLGGIGVRSDHLHVIVPLPVNHAANIALLRREVEYRGLSVIIAKRPCVRSAHKKQTGVSLHDI